MFLPDLCYEVAFHIGIKLVEEEARLRRSTLPKTRFVKEEVHSEILLFDYGWVENREMSDARKLLSTVSHYI